MAIVLVCKIKFRSLRELGEDQPFTKRIFLIYDGIHYDSLVWNSTAQKSQSSDITIFGVEDSYMVEGAEAFVAVENKVI